MELTSDHAGRAFPFCAFSKREPCFDLTSSITLQHHSLLVLPVSNLPTTSQLSSCRRSKDPRSAEGAAKLARLVPPAAERFLAPARHSLKFVLAPDTRKDLATPLQVPLMPQTMAEAQHSELQHARNVLNLLQALELSVEMTRAQQVQSNLKAILTMIWRCSVR